MSTELKQVKQRIGSTRQIGKVTSALQRVAAARMDTYHRAVNRSRRYASALTLLIRDLVAEIRWPTDPLLHSRPGAAVGLIAFGSERGLCGAFNSTLLDRLPPFLGDVAPSPILAFAIGKIVARRLRRLSVRIERAWPQPPAAQREDTLRQVVAEATAAFLDGRVREVYVLHARFVSALRQIPAVERILPIRLPPAPAPLEPPALNRAARAETYRPYPSFEPDPRAILERLLPELLQALVNDAFLNSLASENASRQAAMARASDNAGRVLQSLTRLYRRMRQDNITNNMLELAGSV